MWKVEICVEKSLGSIVEKNIPILGGVWGLLGPLFFHRTY